MYVKSSMECGSRPMYIREFQNMLGSVHKYSGGGGLGKMEGGQKSFESPKGGGTKKFSVVKGGVKKVWSNWKYNEHQNAQFVAKINRI